jgi:mRNA-degrading endonuclease toxin of MazEF toxin-antitoxin module
VGFPRAERRVGSQRQKRSVLAPCPHYAKVSARLLFGRPTTTKEREGTWYVHVRLGTKDEYVCLNQIRTIDYRRLSSKVGQIDTDDLDRVRETFWRLYK